MSNGCRSSDGVSRSSFGRGGRGPLAGGAARAEQSFRRAGVDFNAVRPVEIPAERSYAVVVTMFFHHGQIRPDGKNVVVSARNRTLAPMRVLQVGPGDLCRLAFQPIQGQKDYEVFYGGPAAAEPLPPWTSRDGLLLETRRYSECDLSKFEAVRRAFDAAEPIGADYVPEVRYAWNPVSLNQGPFFSRFSGTLQSTQRIPTDVHLQPGLQFPADRRQTGDGRPGAPWADPGGTDQAPGDRSDYRPGLHKFDYYHAAAGANTTMLAAWIAHPVSDKRASDGHRRRGIYDLSGGPFAGRSREPCGPPSWFRISLMKIAGEVPLPDNPAADAGRGVSQRSRRSLFHAGEAALGLRRRPDQHSANPNHVYLRPGLYKVKLSVKHGGRF